MVNCFDSLLTTYRVARIKRLSEGIVKAGEWSVADLFQEVVRKVPKKQVSFEDRRVTYAELDRLSNQMARWFLSQGIVKGTVVPLMMNNCPEYIAIWLALAKIGSAAALINTNLASHSLLHCLKTGLEQSRGGAKMVIFGDDLATRFADSSVREGLLGCGEVRNLSFLELLSSVQTVSGQTVERSHRQGVRYSDPLYYIYTSGTTGLPKAAKIPHLRFAISGQAFRILYGFRKSDVIYIPLPLYHSNGGMLGVSSAWASKMSMVVREKFSASNYFSDCRRYSCTLGVYIGECCRYILNTPEKPDDRLHPVRKMVGNGLRPDVWERFTRRFGVEMGEFYGSTEGNANLFNNQGKIGAIGYLPPLLKRIYPVKLVRYDESSGELVRDARGFCLECGPDQPGEAIGLINDRDATRRFDGYTDRSDSEKKIARDVFQAGDKWFRTGDLLRCDREGFVYFVDRIGDTFRWKGENVATTEVAEVIGRVPGIVDVNVYGVKVGDLDGRAGMAGFQGDIRFSVDELYRVVTRELPTYARPLFLREMTSTDMTGTFKHRKGDLQRMGFDPRGTLDDIYFRDDDQQTYVYLTPEMYDQIQAGMIRL
jgi:acyl-CoA synthetase (AMP-forming)/AMP-acid ligase II